MRIIPAIDLIEGQCVRLSQGDYSTSKVYHKDPLDMAKAFEDHGIRFLHLVDLDGARSSRIINYPVLERIAGHTSLQIDFGGGIKTEKDLEIAFECGARQVTGGSIAVKNPEMFSAWIDQYGSNRIILGADAKNRKIVISGWEEESQLDVLDFISDFRNKGIQYVICTDVSKDGMLQGPSLELYQEILETQGELSLIASGGISGLEELYELKEIGCEAVIIGKAIYEGKISLKQLENFILEVC